MDSYQIHEIVGPFSVPDGVKINSASYEEFLKVNFEPWYSSRPPNEKKLPIFMQDMLLNIPCVI